MLFLFGINSTSIFAQNIVKKMIDRALEEKSFMKLKGFKVDDERNTISQYGFRDQYGEKLLEDSPSGSESEMFAAINPFDTSNIVVSTIHFAYNQFVDQPLSISTYFTRDFGTTWQKSEFNGVVNNDDIVVGGGDPVLVFDKEGNLHMTYIILALTDLVTFKAQEYIYHAVSTDGGETWTSKPYFESLPFNSNTGEGIDRFLDKQWMVTDMTGSPFDGNIYLGYVDFFGGDTINQPAINIKLDVIHPEDTSFTYSPVTVTDDSFYFVQYTNLDLDNEGNLYIGFVGSYDTLNYYFYTTVSSDGGETFSSPVAISKVYFPGFTGESVSSDITGIKDRYFPSPYISIDNSDSDISGRIYATWTAPGINSIESTASDIYLSYSDDKGQTWAQPLIVNNDSLENSQQFYSNLTINPNGIPVLCFYDKRVDTAYNYKTDYYITYDLNPEDLDFEVQYPMTAEPANFSKIGLKTNGFGIGEYNKTVTTEHFAIPFWSDGRKNDGDVNVYMALIPLDGQEYTVGTYDINLVSDKINLKSISPNPSNGNFALELNLKNPSKTSVEIFDLNGTRIFKRDFGKISGGKNILDINTVNVKSGVYFLKINSEFGYITKKIEIIK